MRTNRPTSVGPKYEAEEVSVALDSDPVTVAMGVIVADREKSALMFAENWQSVVASDVR